ncbi:hypothetical protein HMI54_002239 [Coelomomyces lativittatus]|nr:hypothetical protein HMI56_000533 [Coelomomyces lativittatus]KAJ1509569.1 hypothetical protein HMI55_007339 [Coelomomyces lativittatus]KAJ1518164.1 hypothetical protein HMI54_002239 [Coelomomyces lativittatus]
MGCTCCKEDPIDFDAEIELNHFELLRSVGKGAFGKVRVVQHKKDQKLYALKYINKQKCIQMKAVDNILQERRLLEGLDFNLICNLRFAFQDDENLFMVLDLMLGGDLRFHLERHGPFKEDCVRFYLAEIALGLTYLHEKKIVHRDLKPDNVLLCSQGHVHISDFNIAVKFSENKPLKSIAGSMAYMAPEVLEEKGYFSCVDWWSLGVVAFELLFGKRPFRGSTNEALAKSIISNPLKFPETKPHTISDKCLDCISKLLIKDPNLRLGHGSDELLGFKSHPFFHGMAWEKLIDLSYIPSFIPDPKKSNFDATHELEELLLEENPLKYKKRPVLKPGQQLPPMSKEMKLMEEEFLPFNYTQSKKSKPVDPSSESSSTSPSSLPLSTSYLNHTLSSTLTTFPTSTSPITGTTPFFSNSPSNEPPSNVNFNLSSTIMTPPSPMVLSTVIEENSMIEDTSMIQSQPSPSLPPLPTSTTTTTTTTTTNSLSTTPSPFHGNSVHEAERGGEGVASRSIPFSSMSFPTTTTSPVERVKERSNLSVSTTPTSTSTSTSPSQSSSFEVQSSLLGAVPTISTKSSISPVYEQSSLVPSSLSTPFPSQPRSQGNMYYQGEKKESMEIEDFHSTYTHTAPRTGPSTMTGGDPSQPFTSSNYLSMPSFPITDIPVLDGRGEGRMVQDVPKKNGEDKK